MPTPDYRDRLQTLFDQQRLGVLSTQCGGEPYANLVAFASTPELKHLVFVTTRATTKFHNLKADGRAALLVDSRANSAADFEDAAAVTAVGRAVEADASRIDEARALFIEKHPYLRAFARSPTSAVFVLDVERYVVVDHFQHVVEVDVAQWN